MKILKRLQSCFSSKAKINERIPFSISSSKMLAVTIAATKSINKTYCNKTYVQEIKCYIAQFLFETG